VLEPCQGENYGEHWSFVAVRGKAVLDLGADYGSTASYFLYRGAKSIVAVEGNHELASKLKAHYTGKSNVVAIEEMISNSRMISSLIRSYRPDVAKVDIEGAEAYLLDCSDEALKSVRSWMIEVHESSLRQSLAEKFSRLGFTTEMYDGRMLIVKSRSLKNSGP
jgi:predicted RNA methylase